MVEFAKKKRRRRTCCDRSLVSAAAVIRQGRPADGTRSRAARGWVWSPRRRVTTAPMLPLLHHLLLLVSFPPLFFNLIHFQVAAWTILPVEPQNTPLFPVACELNVLIVLDRWERGLIAGKSPILKGKKARFHNRLL